MARTYSHRRNANGNQLKAIPMEAVYAAGVSIFSVVMYAAIIGASVYLAGETPKWLGGLGLIGFLISLSAFLFNVAQMKTKTEIRYRVVCLTISSVAFLIWAATFILGMVN